jgi:hypothetical protein
METKNIDLLAIIARIRNDPQFFIENFLKIQPKGEPLSPFILNPSQKIVVDLVKKKIENGEPIRLVICKNRQVGMSTLTEALVFWATVVNPSYHSLLVAPSRPRAQSLFEISNTFYENLPDWFRPFRKYKTKNEIIFEQPNEKLRKTNPGLGSSIRITPAKDLTAPRGLALSCAHLSEVPYYDAYMEDFFPALASAIPHRHRTLVIFESTPLGRGGYFYDTYMGAKFKESDDPEVRAMWNGYEPVFLPWMIDPRCSWPKNQITQDEIDFIMSHLDKYEIDLVDNHKCNVYQLKWRREEIKANCNGDVMKFRRENPATEEEAFSLSGTYFFTEEARNYYESIQKEGKKGILTYKGNANLAATTIDFVDKDKLKYIMTNLTPEEKEEYKIELIKKYGFDISKFDKISPIEIFHMPKRDEKYVMGVDPAYGMGRDYSAIVVLDDRLQVCATFYSNEMPIDLFEDEVIKLHKFYNDAMLNLETTGPGNGMMFKLRKNIKKWWAWEKWDSSDKRHKLQSIGFDATNRSNSAIDALLAWAFNSRKISTTSSNIIKEMLVFQYFEESDKCGAPSGYHDDLMRACGLALLSIEDLGSIQYAKKSSEPLWIKPDTGEDDKLTIPGIDNSIMPSWYVD